jgi:colanic acid/amylovoran biosynthesis glycosyltransferase
MLVLEFPSLNETFILDQITGLIDRGHNVDLYATSPNPEPTVHDEIARYDLLARTVYRDSPEFHTPQNRLRRLCKGTPLLIRSLRKNPRAALHSINVFRLGKSAALLGHLFHGAPFLTNVCNYDIIHCQFPNNGELAVSLRQKGIVRGKIVTSFHGYNRPNFQNEKMWELYPRLAMEGELFLAETEHMRQWYLQHHWGVGRTLVHRNPTRLELFRCSSRPDAGTSVRLLSVGRLVEKKGFRYAILAVAKILQRFSNVRYDIVGDGPERGDLEQMIAELGVGQNIRLLGFKNRTEILRLYEEAHILLAPSVTGRNGDQEGLPVVLQEAMASELPVISTYHAGIPELVKDGYSGFLAPERDDESLADRLTHLLQNRQMWAVMGKRGRKHIEENYASDILTDRLLEIYRLLLNHDIPSVVSSETKRRKVSIPE